MVCGGRWPCERDPLHGRHTPYGTAAIVCTRFPPSRGQAGTRCPSARAGSAHIHVVTASRRPGNQRGLDNASGNTRRHAVVSRARTSTQLSIDARAPPHPPVQTRCAHGGLARLVLFPMTLSPSAPTHTPVLTDERLGSKLGERVHRRHGPRRPRHGRHRRRVHHP